MLSNRFVDEWPFSPQFILSTAGNSSPTPGSTGGSFSDPLCTLTAAQVALNCSGAQLTSYPKFPSPFPAPSVEKRMSHGFTLLANYTYSKSLDDLPFGEGVIGFDTGYSALPLNNPDRHKFDYGPSSFDHTHVFTGSYVWKSPTLNGHSSLIHDLFGDYELGGIVSVPSGRSITVLARNSLEPASAMIGGRLLRVPARIAQRLAGP